MQFAVGLTGHRAGHPSYPADDTALIDLLDSLFGTIETTAIEEGASVKPRLTTQLADGADQSGAQLAVNRDWDLSVPLPFGRRLNRALSTMPASAGDIEQILAGSTGESEAQRQTLKPIIGLEGKAQLLEIADCDRTISDLMLRHIREPDNKAVANSFIFETAQRYAIAGRVIIEQSDLLIAIWDGQTHANIGGTGDTVRAALREAIPVLRIDPENLDDWCILTGSEMLNRPTCGDHGPDRSAQLHQIIRHALAGGAREPFALLQREEWQPRSSLRYHAYRRIETLFGQTSLAARLGSIRQDYEAPQEIASGSGQRIVDAIDDLAQDGGSYSARVTKAILERFAWTDAISARLSDQHRSGMIVNFMLGSIAIISGLLYLPLVSPDYKWPFAAIELVVLMMIVVNTASARKRELHGRWFATRRAAEYLRHRPLMLLAGVARPAGQWPHDASEDWPERYVRHSVREVGLPTERIDCDWLHGVLRNLNQMHVVPQRNYHQAKAARLKRAHHALDTVSEWLFFAAIIAVSAYLLLSLGKSLDLLGGLDLTKIGKWLTVAGVAFPTIGGAIAGIRYFGDYERFGEISEVTARRLDEVARRIAMLQQAPPDSLRYPDVAELLRTTDQIVMSELESWQAVFSGKRISVPV